MAGQPLVHPAGVVADRRMPPVITPSDVRGSLVDWLRTSRGDADRLLHEHGAILARGFGIDDADQFHLVMDAWSTELMVYKERSSPRTLVQTHVYTSTDYPADQVIFPHNEHSYAARFPTKIAFCCIVSAASGGETPLTDCRRVLQRIPSAIQSRFRDRGGWMYVRNFGSGIGLSWQTTYQTTDPAVVESYCREHGITCEWKPDDGLRTTQVRPVTARHPVTGEEIWFNHATFFNVGTLPEALRDVLLEQFPLEDLPNNTYYGDGSVIEPETLAMLQQAYLREQVAFPWERGDVLLVDNMLTAHARSSFTGPRTVLVTMADPIDRSALPAS